MINKWIVISAIASLTIIQIVALSLGINGQLMAIIAAMIAGLAGWTGFPQPKIK